MGKFRQIVIFLIHFVAILISKAFLALHIAQQRTIRQMTYKNVIINLFWSILVDLYCFQHYTVYVIATAAVNGGDAGSLLENLTWASFEIPHSKEPIIDTLTALNTLWEYQLSLTIFTLSFFVNHSYSSWRNGEKD